MGANLSLFVTGFAVRAGASTHHTHPTMPKSRRVKSTALTNTVSKGRELKTELIDSIRQAIDKYEHLYVISFENMRSNLFKSLRSQMTDSRIFLGKNKVMTLALGKSEADEYSTELCKVGNVLTGNRCLLFSNDGPEIISKLFDEFQVEDYARSGIDATRTVTLPAGPLTTMIHSMVDPLRKLGLQITLKKGVVTLDRDTDLCNVGKEITPEQAKLLKLFEYKLAMFRLTLTAHWSDGEFTNFDKNDDMEDE
jgi:mRNA turnover protein 4